MKSVIAIVGIVVCAYLAYANFSQVNARSDYIEACLNISETREQKERCYSVYPENHSSNAMIWGVVASIGVVIFIVMILSTKTDSPHEKVR